ncbi:MAG TPA: hypothetical protein VMN60_06770 [Longimicrobiales bacterium]|nr:hypothetical protein [Longimicrobiales bacterium]
MRLLPALFLLLCAGAASAQRPTSAVVPQSITVGDVFHAAVRIELPPRTDVLAPDSLPLPADLELAGRREIRYDTAGGRRVATILYPLTAWRPTQYELPVITLRLVGDGASSSVTVALPGFAVTSVLPLDTTGIEPRGAKDVFGANRLWWPLLLALLLAAAIAIGLYMWWRRRRPVAEEVVVPAVPPRAAVLAALDALERDGLIERGELRLFYIRLTEALRHFAAALEPRWSVDLTTTELAQRMRAAQGAAAAVDLVRILGTGDMVKFARARADAATARADLGAARAWVDRISADVPEQEPRRAA